MAQILPVQSTKQHQLADTLLSPTPLWGTPRQAEPGEGHSAAALIGLLRRHWLLIVGIVAVSLASAYLVTRLMTPVYRASTTLYFADRQGSIPALDLLNQIEDGNTEVATEMEVMHSRALAEVVVDSLGLQARVADPTDAVTSRYFRVLRADPAAPDSSFDFIERREGTFEVTNAGSGTRVGIASPGEPFTFGGISALVLPSALSSGTFRVQVQPRAEVVDELLTQLKVTRPNPTASVVQVSYTSPDRVETKNVPDVLAATYLAWRSSLRKSGDRSTVEFLRRQIDTISTQLYSAEESLRRFREANGVVDLPSQAQTQVQRLAALEAERNDIDMQRTALKNLMDETSKTPTDERGESRYRRLMAFPGLMTTANPAFPLLQTLTDLEQRRADLLVRRTLNDPEVQSLTEAIKNVENQIAAVVDTYVKGLDAQAASLSRGVASFRERVDEVPRREVEYARLDRNATGLTQIYTMLQTRLREAQIAEAVDGLLR